MKDNAPGQETVTTLQGREYTIKTDGPQWFVLHNDEVVLEGWGKPRRLLSVYETPVMEYDMRHADCIVYDSGNFREEPSLETCVIDAIYRGLDVYTDAWLQVGEALNPYIKQTTRVYRSLVEIAVRYHADPEQFLIAMNYIKEALEENPEWFETKTEVPL